MGILRSDRVSGLGGANAINGSVFFGRNGVAATASGNWLTVQSDSDFNFGTGDFTIETWIYYTGTTASSNSGWFQLSNTPGGINNATGASTGGLAGDFENGVIKGIGNNDWFNGTTAVTAQSWIHVAMVRHSGTLQWFINGTADTSVSDSQNYSLTHLAIGGYYTTSYLFSGYISNFRIVKGTAVYSAAFTPPTERLTAIDGTVLLACQSPGNIFQEATGKTLDIRKVNSNDAPPMASRFAPDKGEDHGTTFEDNTKFDTLSYMVPPGGTTAQSNRGRGLIGNVGGEFANGIHYVQIQTSGNSIDFGDATEGKRRESVVCSSTRGLFAGGDAPSGGSETNVISYVTIATTSNATDFGDLTAASGMGSGCSSDTRGVIALGYDHPTAVNTIDYVTIATAGNAADFGDSTDARNNSSSLSSPTRGIWAGGTPSYKDTIDYVTIATTGNATDFGNLATAAFSTAAASSSTRGIFAGGGISASPNQFANNIIQYITIASTGNASDFGDLFEARGNASGLSNSTTAVFAGGCTDNGGSTATNTIDYVTIASLGNAADFGSTTATCLRTQGSSDSHGGLS